MGASMTYGTAYRTVELIFTAQSCGELPNGSWCYAPCSFHLAGSPRTAIFVNVQLLSRIFAQYRAGI